ncbi:hypothetical protein JTE90_016330 [Oedothorax gibbosus]|uniref:Uncharacterized protein n=1 Tax=Oedothorax gibbosus TaxID=931172 RepID=A0AAV6TQ66_9ARAC|nr:hypothetical protein JTE90_016330 [Oedothorax gibbosus]
MPRNSPWLLKHWAFGDPTKEGAKPPDNSYATEKPKARRTIFKKKIKSSSSMAASEDRSKRILRHFDNVHYTATECTIHPRKPCLLILNNFNHHRYHCLYANKSIVWKSYTVSKSCDLPEHFYKLMDMHKQFGNTYVLNFTGAFRDTLGYTLGLFHLPSQLYAPRKIEPHVFKETAYAILVFFCAID